MLNAFKENGNDVRLIVPDHTKGKEKNVDNVFDYYAVSPFRLTYFPWYVFKGSRYIYSLCVAIYLFFFKRQLIYSRDFYPALASCLLGHQVVMEFHGPPTVGKGLKGRMIERFYASSNLKAVVVISEALKKIFIEAGFDASKIIVAHDGSDPIPANVPPYELSGKIKVGYVGHLYQGRGIENIIFLAENNEDVDFHIAGGLEKDIEMWQDKTKHIKNIHFHGFISPAATNSFRAACDVLLAPYQYNLSIWGGGQDTSSYMSPLKIFEYMAAGKPIICSDMPVLREVLNEQNAVLCEPSNFEAWDDALKRILSERDYAHKLAATAQHDFLSKYSWKNRAKYLVEEINNLNTLNS
ncbi:MAG: glycosyltransferase family 4 protein [Leptolyngbya sp. SIO3F4]|nr:glycosyltransferase family 4 protein [Leptolyngbya sp. SIO3F4]